MDLENYKKTWKNQPQEMHKISPLEIYKMAQTRSSSIVKWIFIIGLIEFAFTISSIFLFDTSNEEQMLLEMGVNKIVHDSQYLTIPVFFYFLYLFYKNYRNISITDNTKKLMSKIKKTRKTVRNYVIFNLVYILFFSVIMTIGMIYDPQGSFKDIPGWSIGLSMFIITTILLLLFWGFYQLLYGILLKKLNKNYTELEKIYTDN